MNKRTIRLKALLTDYYVVLVTGFIVLAMAGGYLVYTTHVEPGTEIEQVEESSWSSTAEYTHEAEVLRSTTVFEAGQVLQDRQQYFKDISPVLDGTFQYEYTASDGGDLDIQTNHTLVMRSVDSTDENAETEYWRLERSLGSTHHDSVASDETVRSSYSFNVSSLSQEISRIEDELGGSPGQTEIILETQVSLDGTRNDAPVSDELTYRKTIESSGNIYSVETGGPHTESGERLGEREVEASYGLLPTVGGPALVAVSVLAVLALAIGRWNDTLSVSEREREWLAHVSAHDEFEEWISAGTVPSGVLPPSVVSVDSLEGLVDIAIDSNRRVIQDRSRERYFVLLDDVAYTYDVSHSPEEMDPLAVTTEGDEGDSSADGEEQPDETDGLSEEHLANPTGASSNGTGNASDTQRESSTGAEDDRVNVAREEQHHDAGEQEID